MFNFRRDSDSEVEEEALSQDVSIASTYSEGAQGAPMAVFLLVL